MELPGTQSADCATRVRARWLSVYQGADPDGSERQLSSDAPDFADGEHQQCVQRKPDAAALQFGDTGLCAAFTERRLRRNHFVWRPRNILITFAHAPTHGQYV